MIKLEELALSLTFCQIMTLKIFPLSVNFKKVKKTFPYQYNFGIQGTFQRCFKISALITQVIPISLGLFHYSLYPFLATMLQILISYPQYTTPNEPADTLQIQSRQNKQSGTLKAEQGVQNQRQLNGDIRNQEELNLK